MEEMNLTRQKELAKRISQLNYEYYVLDAPSVSDAEWDALYEEYARLEAESGVILPDSVNLLALLSRFSRTCRSL